MAVTVKFLADVVNWVSGLGKSEKAVDDNATALEDLMAQAIELGVQTGRTTDEIARDFSQAYGIPLDRAKRAVKEVTGELDDLGDAAQDAGKKTESGIDDAASGVSKLKGAASQAGGGLSELGSIAQDVLSGDIAGGAQGAINALASIAGAAGVGGAAGSAVISAISGLVGAMIEEFGKFAAKSAEVKEGIIQDFIDLGDGLDKAAIDRKVKDIFGDKDTRREAELLAQLMGTDLSTAALTMAGDFETAGVTVDEVMKAINDAPGNVNSEDWDSLRATMEGVTDGLKDGPKYADATTEALSRTAIAAAETAVAAGKATKSIDDLGQTVYMMPDGKVVVVDAETGQAITDLNTVQDYILEAKKQGINVDDAAALAALLNIQQTQIDPKTMQVTATVDDSAVKAWKPPTFFASVKANVVGPTSGEYRFQQ